MTRSGTAGPTKRPAAPPGTPPGGPASAPAPEAAPSAPESHRRIPYTPPTVPTPPATRRLAPAVFVTLLLVSDAVALGGALLATWWLRFGSGWFPAPLGVPSLSSYVAALAVAVPLGLWAFRREGLYRPARSARWLSDLADGGRAVAVLTVLLAAVGFFYRGMSFSRTVLVGYAALSVVAVVGMRRGAALAQRALRRRGFGVRRVALAGPGPLRDRLEARIGDAAASGLLVVARLDGDAWRVAAAPAGTGTAAARPTLRPERVRAFLATHRIERLIVTDPDLTHDERLDLVEACHASGARCDFVPDLFEVMMGRARLEEIGGVPLVGARLHPLGRWDRFRKRSLDLVLTVLGLAVLSPLLALIALAVRLDSPGPVLFRQRRLGRDGREFDILKFRSMPTEAERGTGPTRATRDDARPTRVGRVLRRASLDELPQLWNVLKGEMSLVGPRPERPFFVERFERQIPRYLERHGVKSGITGWAQVNGLRGDTSIEDRTRYDIWYVEHWSPWLDVKILVLTLARFLFQDEAY